VRAWAIVAEVVEQFFKVIFDSEHRGEGRAGESLGNGMIHHRAERRKIVVHVEDAAGLFVNAELGPSPLLENFLEGAGTARQRNKCIGQIGD